MAHPKAAVKILELVSKHGVDRFYVGAQGNFDHYVKNALVEVSMLHPNIEFNIVLPQIPRKRELPEWVDLDRTIVPEGIEKTPPRFAVAKVNRWMLERSDYVIGYVTHSFGGASKFLKEAERMGKTVINLACTKK